MGPRGRNCSRHAWVGTGQAASSGSHERSEATARLSFSHHQGPGCFSSLSLFLFHFSHSLSWRRTHSPTNPPPLCISLSLSKGAGRRWSVDSRCVSSYSDCFPGIALTYYYRQSFCCFFFSHLLLLWVGLRAPIIVSWLAGCRPPGVGVSRSVHRVDVFRGRPCQPLLLWQIRSSTCRSSRKPRMKPLLSGLSTCSCV